MNYNTQQTQYGLIKNNDFYKQVSRKDLTSLLNNRNNCNDCGSCNNDYCAEQDYLNKIAEGVY